MGLDKISCSEKLPQEFELSVATKDDSIPILELQKKHVDLGIFQWDMTKEYLEKYLDYENTPVLRYMGEVIGYFLTLKSTDEIFKETSYLKSFGDIYSKSKEAGLGKTCFGQLCVASEWREQGVSKLLHQFFKENSDYDVRFLVIHDDNFISYNAHSRRPDTHLVKQIGENLEDFVFALRVKDSDENLEKRVNNFIKRVNSVLS